MPFKDVILTLMDSSFVDAQTVANFAQYAEMGMDFFVDFVAAIALLIGGLIFANWAHRRVRKVLARIPNLDDTLEPFIAKLVKYSIMIFVVVAVLARFGVQTASMIAVLGAAGLAIGFALQGTLANIAAGIMLLFLRPFRIGDYIVAGPIEGEVYEIGLFSTELKTADGICVVAPNNKIWSETITNYSRNPTRRLRLSIGIGYEDDIDAACDILKKMALEDERVLDQPIVQTFVASLDDSAVTVELRAWINRSDYWDVRREFTQKVKLDFDKASISIPYPQSDVHITKKDV